MRTNYDQRAIRSLLVSPAVLADLRRRGERIAGAAGPGHEVQSYTGRNRVRVTVRTATWPARYHEAVDRRLSNAFRAGA
jgi:hypothetical protein